MHPLDILFWSCLALGSMYTLATVLLGGISHMAGHAGHIGHSAHLPHIGHHGGHAPAGDAHAPHTANGAHGHAQASQGSDGRGTDSAHLDVHSHGAAGEGGGFNILNYLNPMSVAGFLIGFGMGGVASRMLGATPAIGLTCGVAGGGSLYWGAWLIISRVFGAAQGTSHNLREELIGLRAHVTAPIDGSRPGMVCYEVSGARQSLRAITDEPESIPVGALVRIRKIDKNTAQVVRID